MPGILTLMKGDKGVEGNEEVTNFLLLIFVWKYKASFLPIVYIKNQLFNINAIRAEKKITFQFLSF